MFTSSCALGAINSRLGVSALLVVLGGALIAFPLACGSDDENGNGSSTKPDPNGNGSIVGPNGEYAVSEKFIWKGIHAATLKDGTGSTVWWNPDLWDARGDTAYLPATITPDITTGYHIDIHKAGSADPSDGSENNNVYVVGGDGSEGVGAMRMDFEGILSSRLRNPMVISEDKPGIITFRASRFVTTGHWWEIAITPAVRVVGSELTAVPNNATNCDGKNECDDGLHGPTEPDPMVNTAGSGHRPAEESINLITTGFPDFPTCSPDDIQPPYGFRFRVGVKAQIGRGHTNDTWNPVANWEDLPLTTPDEINYLYAWRAEYRPSGIDLYGDFAKDGSFNFHQHFGQNIPWKEVHVHFMGVAYESDHHPQVGCGYQGTVRELNWKDLHIGPLKFRATSVAPKDEVTLNVSRETGWMFYDLRDLQRFGPAVKGIAQANAAVFPRELGAMVSSSSVEEGALVRKDSYDLEVDITPDQANALEARFVYDIKGRGTVTLTVNDTVVGPIPEATTAPGAAHTGAPASQSDFFYMWVQRDKMFDPKLLKAGKNKVHLDFKGKVALDRMQLEFGHR